MAAGGSSGKGLADSGLPLRTDIRASKLSRTFFCWSAMCVSHPIISPSGWLRKMFREIERADECCPSGDDSGAGDQGTGVCGIGDRGTGAANRGAGDSVSGRGSLDEFTG